MKAASIVFVIGLLLLYILDSAFKIYEINVKMLIHNLVRFVAGFVILGIWVLNKKKANLKISLYAILILLLADNLYDYLRNIDTLTFPMMFHDTFVLFWGTAVGFVFYKNNRKKN